MADHIDITLWIDRRWKDAIEKHLKGETLQEHLEDVLDELCNQLPEREYKRISAEIYAEDAVRRTEEEAARTYAAYHVTERGQEWYFKTSPGEELLVACKKLRGYITAEKGTAPDKFIGMFFGGQPITAKEFDALTALRMENTGKVRGVFDVNFDKREFSAVHIMDGWRTWAMRDVSPSVYHATRSRFASADEQLSKLLELLDGMEITSAGHLSARNFSFADTMKKATAPSSPCRKRRRMKPSAVSTISSSIRASPFWSRCSKPSGRSVIAGCSGARTSFPSTKKYPNSPVRIKRWPFSSKTASLILTFLYPKATS